MIFLTTAVACRRALAEVSSSICCLDVLTCTDSSLTRARSAVSIAVCSRSTAAKPLPSLVSCLYLHATRMVNEMVEGKDTGCWRKDGVEDAYLCAL